MTGSVKFFVSWRTYRCIVFQKRVIEFKPFDLSSGKETILADIKVEVFKRPVSKTTTTEKQKWNSEEWVWVMCEAGTNLKPTIGYSLQIEHLASCRAVSAAASRCITGSHTIDCGSSLSHSRKLFRLISVVLLAFSQIDKWNRQMYKRNWH